MAPQSLTQTQQTLSAALAGTWKLAAGRAISFRPREAGVLRVAHGQVWATYDGPHSGHLNDLGDFVVGVGGELRLCAGQRLVIQAWHAKAPSYFSWDPLPATVRTEARLARVNQPMSDLRLAVGLGASAAHRLAAGLAGLAWELLSGRGRNTLHEGTFVSDARACHASGAAG